MTSITRLPCLHSCTGIRARLPPRSSSTGSLLAGPGRRKRATKACLQLGLRKREPVDSGLLSSTSGRPGWPMLRPLEEIPGPESPSCFSQTWQPTSRPRTPPIAAESIAAGAFSPTNGCRSPCASRPTTAESRSSSLPTSAASSEKRVNFRLSRVSTHSVIPYSEVYGRHPSFFDFTRKGHMVMTNEGVADEMRHLEL